MIDRFWQSFETHAEFNPEQSHDPVDDWNRMKSKWEAKL